MATATTMQGLWNVIESRLTFVPQQRSKKEFRRLRKKYRSLSQDLLGLKKSLEDNPKQGADLGNGLRKVRMAISSKNKGKSGGARVITCVEAITAELDGTLILLYIYDKSELPNIPDCKLKELLAGAM